MKVRVVVRRLSHYGGAEFVALRFARFLHEAGALKEVVCAEAEGEFPFPVIKVKLLRPSRFLKTISFNLAVNRYLKEREEKGIVNFAFSKVSNCHVFINGGGTHLGFVKASLKALPPVERAIKRVRRAFNPINYYNPKLEEEIFRSSREIIATSEKVKEEMLLYYGHLGIKEKITVVPNPTDVKRFNREVRLKLREGARREFGIEEGEVALGFASSNFTLKGLRQLIEALQLLPQKFKLIVAGGRNPKGFLKEAQRLGVEKRVKFLGKVKEMEKFYSAVDVLTHPSFYDTFGNVVTEALSMGVPVVCSRETGAKDFVKEGVNGFVLNEINPKEIAEKVRRAAQLPPFKTELPTDEEVFEKYLLIGERSLNRG